jgi:alkylhydroperoxidase family enzyme
MSAEQEPELSHASMSVGAVFLSYAAEDAAAAERIAVALRGVVLACASTCARRASGWRRQTGRRKLRSSPPR